MDPPRRRGASQPVVLIPSYCPPKGTTSSTKEPILIPRKEAPKETINPAAAKPKFLSPITKTVIEDREGDDSAEEEIVTAGARATLNNSPPPRRTVTTRPNISFETHYLPGDPSSEEEELESELESELLETPHVQTQETKPRPVGFPPVEELPHWFPKKIKEIYRVDRHGGALSYKELNAITRYRAALEIIYRRKWREYTKAGNARWKLQQALHRLKRRPLTKPFYKYRKEQFREWKAKALQLWKRLEKTHRGILILESTININFRQERMIHEKHLKVKPL